MNWESILVSIFKLIPYVVSGVNTIHAEKDSATKTQMAQDALSVATQAAAQILAPNDENIANAVSAAVSGGIASVQAVHDAVTGSPAIDAQSTVTDTATSTAPSATSQSSAKVFGS